MESPMRIHITARHLRLTKPLRSYVEEKVSKAQRYFEHLIWAQVVLTIEKLAHSAEIVIHASKHTFRSKAQGSDLYSAIDLASDKIDIQLRKHKEKVREHKNHLSTAEAFGSLPAVIAPRISVIKEVPVQPMSHEEAVAEMERMGYNFWLFLEKDSRQVHLVYRRQDESYGVLKPRR